MFLLKLLLENCLVAGEILNIFILMPEVSRIIYNLNNTKQNTTFHVDVFKAIIDLTMFAGLT